MPTKQMKIQNELKELRETIEVMRESINSQKSLRNEMIGERRITKKRDRPQDKI